MPGELRRHLLVAGIILMMVLATFVDSAVGIVSRVLDGVFMGFGGVMLTMLLRAPRVPKE